MTAQAQAQAPKAKKQYLTGVRQCHECGCDFRGKHPKALFCTPAHQQAFHNRSSAIGRTLVPLLKARMALKGKEQPEGLEKLWQLCDQLIRDAINEDVTVGRPGAVAYAKAKAALFTLDPRDLA